MSNPDTILDEIHAIRRKINEDIKGMTPEEIREYFRKDTEAIIKEYGMKVISDEEKEILRKNARSHAVNSDCCMRT